MFSDSISVAQIKRCSAYAIAIGFLAQLVASSARAQTQPTTWQIQVSAPASSASNASLPSYAITIAMTSLNQSGNTCNTSVTAAIQKVTTNQIGDIYVCPGDTVLWQYATATGEMVIEDGEGILLDNNGGSPHWFHAFPSVTGTPASVGGVVDPTSTGSHKYVIAFYDSSTPKHLYVHDPQIIIGTGT